MMSSKNFNHLLIYLKSKNYKLFPGGVVEWFKALVLKTSVSARAPWVRIPPPPLPTIDFSKKIAPYGVFFITNYFHLISINFANIHAII